MESTLSSTVILWLIAANFLLMVFIVIDRFRINHKKAVDLEDQFVKEALKNLHTEIQRTNKQLSDNTIQFQQNAQNQTLELLASIRSTIFSRYETEFKSIDDSVKKNIQNIDNEVSHVVQEIRSHIQTNNEHISDKFQTISQELEDSINKIISESQEKMRQAAQTNSEHTAQYLKQQTDQKINQIVAEVLLNRISLHDHEQLIEDAVQEYLKQKKD